MGALLCGLAVVLGAFGAHALKGTLTPEMLAVYETGVRYQMYTGLGVLALGEEERGPQALLALGAIIFSGSLYLLVFSGIKLLGAITPLGGLCMIAGWFWAARNLMLRGKVSG